MLQRRQHRLGGIDDMHQIDGVIMEGDARRPAFARRGEDFGDGAGCALIPEPRAKDERQPHADDLDPIAPRHEGREFLGEMLGQAVDGGRRRGVGLVDMAARIGRCRSVDDAGSGPDDARHASTAGCLDELSVPRDIDLESSVGLGLAGAHQSLPADAVRNA